MKKENKDPTPVINEEVLDAVAEAEDNAMLVADHRIFAKEFGKVAEIVEIKFGADNTLTSKVKSVAAIMQSMTDQEILDFITAGEDL